MVFNLGFAIMVLENPNHGFDDVKKTTIITKSCLYKWNVMSFGLKTTTSTFSRTMVDIFKKWNNWFLKVFVDDVNIHNGTWFEPLHHIWFVLQKLFEVNFKLNPSKCCFGFKSITFLGRVVDHHGSQLDPSKVVVFRDFPMPKTSTNVKAFLGLTCYYSRFIVGYVKVAKPLFSLTKKACRFV
jgi:hypothetical protein